MKCIVWISHWRKKRLGDGQGPADRCQEFRLRLVGRGATEELEMGSDTVDGCL